MCWPTKQNMPYSVACVSARLEYYAKTTASQPTYTKIATSVIHALAETNVDSIAAYWPIKQNILYSVASRSASLYDRLNIASQLNYQISHTPFLWSSRGICVSYSNISAYQTAYLQFSAKHVDQDNVLETMCQLIYITYMIYCALAISCGICWYPIVCWPTNTIHIIFCGERVGPSLPDILYFVEGVLAGIY